MYSAPSQYEGIEPHISLQPGQRLTHTTHTHTLTHSHKHTHTHTLSLSLSQHIHTQTLHGVVGGKKQKDNTRCRSTGCRAQGLGFRM
jgi:hypothetical protein